MTHEHEADLEDRAYNALADRYGEANVTQQYYFDTLLRSDLYVDLGACALVIECESRHENVRPGVAQAMQYARHDLDKPTYPMLLVADGHLPRPAVREKLPREVELVEESDLYDHLAA